MLTPNPIDGTVRRTVEPAPTDEIVYPERWLAEEWFGKPKGVSVLHLSSEQQISKMIEQQNAGLIDELKRKREFDAECARLLEEEGAKAQRAYIAKCDAERTTKTRAAVADEHAAEDSRQERVRQVMDLLVSSVLGKIPAEPSAFPSIKVQVDARVRQRRNLNAHVAGHNIGSNTMQLGIPDDQVVRICKDTLNGLGVSRNALIEWLRDHNVGRKP